MIELWLRSGKRALIEQLDSSDAYGAAWMRIEQLGFARHEIMFEGYRPGVLLFSVTPTWTRALPAMPELPPLGDNKAWILGMARAFGFPLAGISSPELAPRYTDRFKAWIAAGAHGDMHYLERQHDKRLQPSLVHRHVCSVLAVATPYSPSRPAAIARYATGRDYHEVMSARLDAMKRAIRREFPDAALYTSVDTGPVLERAYAEQAGLGWIGKNGVLISRTHGSYLSLATLWTPFDLTPDAPHAEFCGSCADCMHACPTGAITQPGWVEAPKCIAYWTIETTGALPDTHGWLFGCDACQEACPWNRFAAPVTIADLAARDEPLPDAEAWLAASDDALLARIAQTPLRRVGPAGMRRNARRLLPIVE